MGHGCSFLSSEHLIGKRVRSGMTDTRWPPFRSGAPQAREHDVHEVDGIHGQQVATDTGPMVILAISKDRTRQLVIELKRGRASDVVVGQIQSY